jgi:hypothetical protein
MRYIILTSILMIAGFVSSSFSQDDIQIGSSQSGSVRDRGGYFDYSDPNAVNIKVQLWGYVRFSGYYIVPTGTSINELISYAGGPLEDAMLEDIRVTKIKENYPSTVVKYNYNDLMWESEIKNPLKYGKLEAGDIVVVPGEPRYFVREDIAFYLGVITALASVTALIISIIYANN